MSNLDLDLDSLFDDPKEKTKEKPKQPKEEPKQDPKDEKQEKVEEKKPDPKPEPKPVKEEKPKTEEKKPEKKSPPIKEYMDDDGYDTQPEKESDSVVFCIYAKKGVGKTFSAFSLPGVHSCISFDHKSARIASIEKYKDRVTVYDGLRYYDRSSSDLWLESSTKSWNYIKKLLDRIETHDKPDWISIDGGEIVHTMFEMVMRDRNGIRPFQGISNKNLWKYRKMLIGQLLSRCQEIAKRGVIWTSYITFDEIIKDGDFVSREEVPKWIASVLYETDCVIRLSRSDTKNGQRFYGTVQSSKWKYLKESPKIDITDDGIVKLFDKDYIKKMIAESR